MNIVNYSYLLKTTLFAILYGLVGMSSTAGQNYLFDLDIINIEDGLPHRNTYDIVQDKEGFIWVSSLGAISRYDGYQFKTYLFEAENKYEKNVDC